MSERKRRVFPEAFKREAVDRVETSGVPIGRIAAELGLHETRTSAVGSAVRGAGDGPVPGGSGGRDCAAEAGTASRAEMERMAA